MFICGAMIIVIITTTTETIIIRYILNVTRIVEIFDDYYYATHAELLLPLVQIE